MERIRNVHTYIIIEKFDPDYPTILTDEEGRPLMFEDYIQAVGTAREECQDGQVVTLT